MAVRRVEIRIEISEVYGDLTDYMGSINDGENSCQTGAATNFFDGKNESSFAGNMADENYAGACSNGSPEGFN